VGPDGVSHQAIEDIAIMRVIPGVVVLAPTDGNQVFSVLRAAIDEPGPVFIRLERSAIPLITREADPIHIGGSNTLVEGNDAAVIAIGSMAVAGVEAANLLAHEGVNVRVISMVSIKPIDEAAIIRSARDTGALVVAEDHNCNAGLGGAVAEVVVRTVPVPIEQVAVRDIFAESGQADELREKYHLTSYDIGRAVRRVMERREQLGWASR
jgi:transketolase